MEVKWSCVRIPPLRPFTASVSFKNIQRGWPAETSFKWPARCSSVLVGFSPNFVKNPCQICSVADAYGDAEKRYKPQQYRKDELPENCQHQLILVASGCIASLLNFNPGFRISVTCFDTRWSVTSGRPVA